MKEPNRKPAIRDARKPAKLGRQSPILILIKTKRGNTVSMAQITPAAANALRNHAYTYLA